MSFRFWPTDDESIDLGSSFAVLAALKEISDLPGDHDDLRGVVNTDDQDLEPDYVAAVKAQAAAVLAAHGGSVSDPAREVLQALAKMDPVDGPEDGVDVGEE